MTNLKDLHWLRQRQNCVTATDTRALCGLGYANESIERLYAEKLAAVPTQREPSERERIGLALESEVAARYTERTGLETRLPDQRLTLRPDYPWQGASLDRLASTYDNVTRAVELKCVFQPPNDDYGEEGSDSIPERFIIQAQKQMACANVHVCDVAVLFVGYTFRVYQVHYDAALCNLLTQIDRAFWRFVEEREAPPADWQHPYAVKVRESLVRCNPLEKVNLGPDAAILAERYTEAKSVEKEAGKLSDKWKSDLIEMMGAAAVALLPGGGIIRRGTVEEKLMPAKPAYTRAGYATFRISHPKLKAIEE